MLASLNDEILEKQNARIRQAVHTNPELLEFAVAKINSSFIRDRFIDYDSINDAYSAGGLVADEINAILAKDLCADLIAPAIASSESRTPAANITHTSPHLLLNPNHYRRHPTIQKVEPT